MQEKVIAIFDIGKTNKKVLLFDSAFQLIHQEESVFAPIQDEDGEECDDIQLITDWMEATLQQLIDEGYLIAGVNFSTYGASLLHLDQNGKVLSPLYNYLKEIDQSVQQYFFDNYGGSAAFCRRTASPALGAMLNSGVQLLWLKNQKPEIWSKRVDSLHFPQYLSYYFTKQLCADPTSNGCHTFLWDFDQMEYHPWLQQEGIIFPSPLPNSTCFPVKFGGQEILFGIGIHDSSAALVPYLSSEKEAFALISTGTWCINMNPFNNEPLTENQLKEDCLCFLTPEQKQVKSSRVFLGHFHNVWTQRLSEYFEADPKFYKVCDASERQIAEVKNMFSKELYFFPSGTEAVEEALKQVDLSVFKNIETAYIRLVSELATLCVNAIQHILPQQDETKKFFVTGGFARNPIFIKEIKTAFPEKRICLSEIDNASALGAALVLAPALRGFSTDAVQLEKEISEAEKV
ncbi:FGGY family carbohydrate kinase [Persicobacter diffluens]|uniref:Carbohydrate kinase n=1 Tax=Persicobacter diffluens TaxID=981 RepID=A0AAN4W3R8_9BACT|nr:carbohydrate kinase [Persicobacter diffluens]